MDAVKKELPKLEGFDFDYAVQITLNEEILRVLLIDFYVAADMLKDKLQGLFADIEKEDTLALYRIEVHALKSTSASIGALSLSDLARNLEQAAIAKNISGIQALHPVLIEELMKHKERISILVPKKEEKKTAGKELNPYFGMLKNSLANFDFNSADMLSKEIQKYQFADSIQPLVDKLVNQILQLEADEAVATIKEIEAGLKI